MSIEERLDKLRLKRGFTWDELGIELKLSRAMLHYVRKCERAMSERALFRLAEAERAAGITPPLISYGEQQPNAAMLHDTPAKKVIAKLRRQVEELLETINELES